MKQETATQKTYVKPQVKQVRLVAEEAVLATCKTGSIAGFDACDERFEDCGGFQPSS